MNIAAEYNPRYQLSGRTLLSKSRSNGYFTHNYPIALQPGETVTFSYTMQCIDSTCNTPPEQLIQPSRRSLVKPQVAESCNELLFSHSVDNNGSIMFHNLDAFKYPMVCV